MVRLCQKFSRDTLFDSPPQVMVSRGFLNPGDPMDLSNRDFPYFNAIWNPKFCEHYFLWKIQPRFFIYQTEITMGFLTKK